MSTVDALRVAACAFFMFGVPVVAQEHLTPEQQAAARQALIAWFECVECTDGELKALTNFGPAVEGALIATLRDGLSPAKRAQVEQDLLASYNQSSPMERDRYVSIYLSNKDARYRSRAAEALAQLASPNAAAALDRAVADSSLRADVRMAAGRALARLRPP